MNDTEQTRIGLGIGADTYTTGSSGKHPWIVILHLRKPRYRNGQDAHQGGDASSMYSVLPLRIKLPGCAV